MHIHTPRKTAYKVCMFLMGMRLSIFC